MPESDQSHKLGGIFRAWMGDKNPHSRAPASTLAPASTPHGTWQIRPAWSKKIC